LRPPAETAGMLQLSDHFGTIAEDLQASLRIFDDELASDQEFINDHCRHVGGFHGKLLRPALLLVAARACGRVTPDHHMLAAVVEMVHIATLVHDDVLDEADARRRAPTVNRLWGNERAVLLGDYLISHAFHLCSSLDSQYASRLVGRTANTVCEGEMMQVVNRDNLELSEAEYTDIIQRKTASLIGTCCELGAHYAGADERTVHRLREYGVSLGIAFQITDDLLDLLGDEDEAGKSLGRDVEKGKLTLPLIHYLRDTRDAAPASHARMLSVLRDHHAVGSSRAVAALLQNSRSVEYAQAVAGSYIDSALRDLNVLAPGQARDTLAAIAEFVLARRQ
jgi:octaprenyl-diphosphate synthase